MIFNWNLETLRLHLKEFKPAMSSRYTKHSSLKHYLLLFLNHCTSILEHASASFPNFHLLHNSFKLWTIHQSFHECITLYLGLHVWLYFLQFLLLAPQMLMKSSNFIFYLIEIQISMYLLLFYCTIEYSYYLFICMFFVSISFMISIKVYIHI